MLIFSCSNDDLTNKPCVVSYRFIEVTEYPFVLQEKGWGEFDMKIMLHFVEKSVPPFVLDHDLNFQQNHYEIPQTIVRDSLNFQ
jgi:transcription initiation factor IIF auxiliary subunit